MTAMLASLAFWSTLYGLWLLAAHDWAAAARVIAVAGGLAAEVEARMREGR